MTVTERLDWRTDTDTGTAAWSRTVAGVAFATAGGWFAAALALSAALVPEYGVRSGSISALGVAPESAVLFNGSLLAVGALTVAGGYLFYRAHRTPWLLAAFVVAGLGAIGAGLFPQSTGVLHAAAALIGVIAYDMAAVGTGVRIRGPMVVASVLLGAVGLLFVVLLPVGDGGGGLLAAVGRGGADRLVVYPALVWLLVFGGYLVGSRSSDGAKDSLGA